MNGFRVSLSALVLLALASVAHGDVCEKFPERAWKPEFSVCDRENADDSVILLIAGLGGSKTWKQLRDYINADDELAGYDLLDYYTPKSMNIEGHLGNIASIVNERWPDLKNLVIVGHSVGGIVVRTLAIEDPDTQTFPVAPQFVVTYATPFEEEGFHTSWWQRFASGFAFLIGALQPLQEDAFDEAKIARYTDPWREKIEQDEDAIAERYLAIYGVSDRTAPATNELGKPFVVLIEGTHKNVVKPRKSDTCPFRVLKHMIVKSEHGPGECLR